MPGPEVADRGADERGGIHARMPAEVPVFELDEGCCAPVGDGVTGRETPLLVVRDAGPQQFAAAVRDDGSVGYAFEKVLRQAAEPACQKDRNEDQIGFLGAGHRVTAAVAEAVLAATCGSYIAEQVMDGRV